MTLARNAKATALTGLVFLTMLVAGAPVAAQTSVDLAVEVRSPSGRALGDATPRLRLFEGGVETDVVEASAPVGGAPRVVLYIDVAGSRRETVRRVVSDFVGELESTGQRLDIEVVRADPFPRTVLPPGAEADEANAALSGLIVRVEEDADELTRVRTEFLMLRDSGTEDPDELLRGAVELELELRRRQQDALLLWLAAQGASREPRLLLLANDNLGLEVSSFYGASQQEALEARLAAADGIGDVARTAAAYGWTVVPLLEPEATEEGRLRYQPSSDTPVGFRLGLGGSGDRGDAEDADDRLGLATRDLDQLAHMASQTGGELSRDGRTFTELLDSWKARRIVRYSPADLRWGAVEQIALEPVGADLEVLAPRFVGRGTPEAVAEARARLAIAGTSTDADLPVRSAIEFDSERLGDVTSRYEVRVDLFDLERRQPDLDRVSLRMTLAVHLDTGELLLRHDTVHDVSLEDRSAWQFDGSLRLPPGTDGAVALVELLDTGDWGESFASFVAVRSRPEATVEDRASSASIVDARRAIRIEPPTAEVQLGRVTVRAAAEAEVRRVVFELDGKRVGTRRRAPFEVALDLGSEPSQRLLVAIAYGDGGEEIGRDALLLNEAAPSFNVRIVEPRAGRRNGPVEVAADVRMPDEGRLDRVDFFWQDELIGSATGEPYRQRIFIPLSSELGFIRVAAHLDDGRIAEDVVLMNADQFEDELTVRLVELYVVVTDRENAPVLGLGKDDFVVRDSGVGQELEAFKVAGNLPITVGLAIDSSLSLFMKMPEVQDAAASFVDSLSRDQDRAFLVGFGSRPTLVRPTTGNLASVSSGISSLRPGGTTALWEAISLALSQLRRSTGRKALVVFYDGDDEDEDYAFNTSFKLAQESGVPIYLIVMNNAAARSNGASFGTKTRAGRLDRLARAGGGRVFYVRTDEDLGEIFGAITDELRSHYLLTYYPQRGSEEETGAGWRDVEVEVTRRGLTARTLEGYGDLLRLSGE